MTTFVKVYDSKLEEERVIPKIAADSFPARFRILEVVVEGVAAKNEDGSELVDISVRKLESMKYSELRTFAKKVGLNVSGNPKKETIIKMVKEKLNL